MPENINLSKNIPVIAYTAMVLAMWAEVDQPGTYEQALNRIYESMCFFFFFYEWEHRTGTMCPFSSLHPLRKGKEVQCKE